jgi:3'(2'), 5'-bisphosphate nucleotidase
LNLKELLPITISAAQQACIEILDIYHSGDFQAEAKGDNSPLTLADRRAHLKIAALLEQTGLPILSEEGKAIPYEIRKNWEYFWMVDPLDGTKEFIKRNGEFTVNIALIHQGMAVLGVVAIPVSGEVFYAAVGLGAFKKEGENIKSLGNRAHANLTKSGLRVVASRSHMDEETVAFIGKLQSPELVSKGSSLKFLLLAEGKADVYPRFAPTMEWDTAAAHAIVNEVGCKVYQYGSDDELAYNKKDLLNPSFIAL